MSLASQITEELKTAMKAKDTVALEALRAIKSALLLAQIESGAKADLDPTEEIKLLQRLVKQRKDSASIYTEQGRADLAAPELEQIKVIERFLPQQLSEEEVDARVKAILDENGLSGMANMGKAMGLVTAALSGQADGKLVSSLVKKHLGA